MKIKTTIKAGAASWVSFSQGVVARRERAGEKPAPWVILRDRDVFPGADEIQGAKSRSSFFF